MKTAVSDKIMFQARDAFLRLSSSDYSETHSTLPVLSPRYASCYAIYALIADAQCRRRAQHPTRTADARDGVSGIPLDRERRRGQDQQMVSPLPTAGEERPPIHSRRFGHRACGSNLSINGTLIMQQEHGAKKLSTDVRFFPWVGVWKPRRTAPDVDWDEWEDTVAIATGCNAGMGEERGAQLLIGRVTDDVPWSLLWTFEVESVRWNGGLVAPLSPPRFPPFASSPLRNPRLAGH